MMTSKKMSIFFNLKFMIFPFELAGGFTGEDYRKIITKKITISIENLITFIHKIHDYIAQIYQKFIEESDFSIFVFSILAGALPTITTMSFLCLESS